MAAVPVLARRGARSQTGHPEAVVPPQLAATTARHAIVGKRSR
jgi:hypothetical protein